MTDASEPTSGEEEEEDYMSMVIAEPTKIEKETSIQRRARKQREAETKSRVKSKAEREADEAAARDAALATSIDSSNKGFKLMAKLGYKPGSTLGKTSDARSEPIHLVMKEDRGGIGLDTEKKRKFREQVEQETKRVKAEEGDYRERMRLEREEKRLESQLIGAQKVAERLDTETQEEANGAPDEAQALHDAGIKANTAVGNELKPLKGINVLWRGLVRHRVEVERERRMRYDLQQSLSRLPTYEDPDEEDDDKLALGKTKNNSIIEEELEEEDPELEEFNALEPAEKLNRLVQYLRDTFRYCFWCKFRYPDASMDGCPGVKEEDHD